MADLFVQLLDQYDSFLERLEQLSEEETLAKAQELLGNIKEAGKRVLDPEERSILSNLASDLSDRIYNVSGSYPSALLKSPTEKAVISSRGARPNPFIYGRPVRSSEFLNREAELRTIFNRLRNGESTAVVGEPHIGKTSLLLRLADEETQLRYLGDSAQRVKFSSLNLHYISNDYSPSAFWEKALTPLRDCPDWDSVAGRLEQAAQAGYSGDSLEELFYYLYEQKRQVVLLLDEFEQLLRHPGFQDFSFFATLRAVDSFPSFSTVVTSRLALEELEERVHELPHSGGSPVFNTLQEKRLLPFDEDDIEALLNQAGSAFSHDDRCFIRFIAGRHPYLVQTMASALLETTGDDHYVRATEQFYSWTRSYSDDLWSILNERARTTIVVLGLVELGNYAAGSAFDYTEIQSVDVLGFRLRDLAQLGLAEQVDADWPFGMQHSLLWRGERWILGTRALAFWMYDVIIAESRRVSAYDEWLKGKGYCSLLTQEQWNWLLDTVRNACGQKIGDIGTLAGNLFEELIWRK